jgi:calcineurin-like phosphoesterase family protein
LVHPDICPDTEPLPSYRLDLRLGIPQSRIQGSLEGWVGDAGLTRHPDDHPYIVLADVAATEGKDQQGVMDAVAQSAEKSGPIQVEIDTAPGASAGASWYSVNPSPGLRSFILILCRSCPVLATPGSLVHRLDEGKKGSFVVTPVLPRAGKTEEKSRVHKQGNSLKTADEDRNRGMQNRSDECQGKNNGSVMMDILRIVLRKGGSAVAEYDLARKQWLSGAESVQGKNAKVSLRSYRIDRGLQMIAPHRSPEPEILIISDLHLGHANGIPRYKRPFFSGNVREMDRVLIRNWNWTVKKSDIVIFLGDLSYMSEEKPESYLQRLGGSIFFLEGNHDPYYPYMSHCLLMRYHGVPYLFIHNPEELVRPFDGWVIHGHAHNKDLATYPFFNPHERRINVSAEMIGYRPISLKEIHSLVLGRQEVIRFRKVLPGDDSRSDQSMVPSHNSGGTGCDCPPVWPQTISAGNI